MKKVLLFIFVAAFAVSVPLSASAVETSIHGILWTTFSLSNNVGSYSGTLADDFNKATAPGNRTYAYNRAIPRLFLKFSDDLQYVLGWDTGTQNWGGASEAGGYTFGSYVYSAGSDFRVRWQYMDFRIPTTPARLKIGTQTLRDFASSMVVLTGEFPSIRLDTPLGKGKLTAFWGKMGEGDSGESVADDADFYSIQVAYPVTDNITVTPMWIYAHGDGAHACASLCFAIDGNAGLPGHAPATLIGMQGKDIHWLGANLKGNFKSAAGPLSLKATVFGATGDYDETHAGGVKGDYSGFLFEAQATLDMGAIKPGIIVLFTSGDDNLTASDRDRELFPQINSYYNRTNLFGTGFVNYQTAISASPSGQLWGDVPGIPTTANGITMFQINVSMKPLKNLTVKPAISLFRSSENWAGYTPPGSSMAIPNTDKDMGVEYGSELIYQVYKNLRWHTYIGVFDPGDFYQWVDGTVDAADSAFMLKSSIAVLF